ncbi:MAG TPA: GIY-YIG nuclease family protein, partial [bacterium]|nr:GIY-YIG nuclease family protein [bacterium]
MHFVYVLKSKRDSRHYIGVTADLARRVEDHNAGKVSSTSGRRPFELIYFEEFEKKDIAEKRERF